MTGRRPSAGTVLWAGMGALVLTEIGYPLVTGAVRARLVVLTVVVGYALSLGHAVMTRGPRAAAALVLVTTGGGLAVEITGVATGFPFGGYAYTDALGTRLAGVPLVIPLAWTWLAWPAWLAAGRLTGSVPGRVAVPVSRWPAGRPRTVGRVVVAGLGLASWDLFLDPQMVHEGYWRWAHPHPALPGVPAVPAGNYLGWLGVSMLLMALLAAAGGRRVHEPGRDGPMHASYLWTYASSVLAHLVFLGLPGSALWGGAGMGLVAGPLAGSLMITRGGTRPAGLRAGRS